MFISNTQESNRHHTNKNKFFKSLTEMSAVVQACNTAVKELGDFENYFQVLQREAGELADMLELLAAKRAVQAEGPSRP
jgi:hypothetical protein